MTAPADAPRPTRVWLVTTRRWLLRLGVSALLIWLGVSGAATWRLSHRERPVHPELVPPAWASELQTLRLLADDGVQFGAWFQAGRDGLPAVVLVHGNGGSRSGMLAIQLMLHDQGLTTLAITVRAHGDAEGERNDVGWSARHDVRAAMRFLRQRAPRRPVVVFGQSLGAAAAVFAAAEPDAEIAGLWLECPYRDLDSAVRNRLRAYLPAPLRPVAWVGLRLWANVFLPAFSDISPADAIARVPADVPVWVLAGGEDALAPAAEARQVLGDHRGAFVVIPTGGHLTLRMADEARWLHEWQAFLGAVSRRHHRNSIYPTINSSN